MAQVEFLDANKIFRAANEEITGHQSSGSDSDRGQKASGLRHKLTDKAIKEMLPSGDPSTLLVDNRTLSQSLMYTMSKPAKKLKILVRHINIFKEAIRNGEVEQILVGTRDQPADMLTKAQTSPTLQWLHLETLQGTHSAITKIKKRVADMRNRRMSQGRMKQLSSTDEIEMDQLMATVAISGADMTDSSVRAAREIEIETKNNTTEQAKESEEMIQFRLDIKDRVKRKFCHMETQQSERMMIDEDDETLEDGKETSPAQHSRADDDEDSSNKRQRKEQSQGEVHRNRGAEQGRQNYKKTSRGSKGSSRRQQERRPVAPKKSW
jgi:hypothetical protein